MTQAIPKPLPVTDEDTKPFWDYCKKRALRAQKCLKCGGLHYPPSPLCPHCLSMESEWVKLSGRGKVFTYIVAHRRYHPGFSAELPYIVAVIETDEGLRMLSNVIECKPDAARIDMPVEVVFEDANPEFALPKFRPA